MHVYQWILILWAAPIYVASKIGSATHRRGLGWLGFWAGWVGVLIAVVWVVARPTGRDPAPGPGVRARRVMSTRGRLVRSLPGEEGAYYDARLHSWVRLE